MNLADLKAMAGDAATVRTAELETEVARKEKVIRGHVTTMQQQEKQITVLQNRCFALTRGMICIMCGFANTCGARKAVLEKLEKREEKR